MSDTDGDRVLETDGDRLRALAEWFDYRDSPGSGDEVQRDLRRMAERLDELDREEAEALELEALAAEYAPEPEPGRAAVIAATVAEAREYIDEHDLDRRRTVILTPARGPVAIRGYSRLTFHWAPGWNRATSADAQRAIVDAVNSHYARSGRPPVSL